MRQSLSPIFVIGIVFVAIILDLVLLKVSRKYFTKRQIGPGMKERLSYLCLQLNRGVLSVLFFVRALISRVFVNALKVNDQLILTISIFGSLFIGYSLWIFRHGTIDWRPWVLLVVGAAFFIFGGMSIYKIDAQSVQVYKQELLYRSPKWQKVCLILSPCLAVVASAAAGFGPQMEKPELALIAWFAGIIYAMVGGWDFQRRKTNVPFMAIFIALLFTGIALVIRTISIKNIPIVLCGDEALAGITASKFASGEFNNPFIAGWFLFPSLYSVVQAAFIRVLGQTIDALRWSSAIIGACTVGGVYLVARALYGKRTGVFSAIFLSAFYFHNHFSRLGLNNAWDAFWFVIAMGALWAGWHKQDRRYFVVAGFAMGIAQYFYVSARVMPFLMFAWLIVVGLMDRERFRKNIAGIGSMWLVAFVIAFPMYWYYANHPIEFIGPMRRVSSLGPWLENEVFRTFQPAWLILTQQIIRSFQGYVHFSMRSIYTLGEPLLRFPAAVSFCLAISVLILRLRDARSWLFLIWLGGFGLLGGLSEGAPAAQRMVAVIPAAAILVGYGLSEFVERFHIPQIGPRVRKLVEVLIIIVLLVISADELRYYFFDYTRNGNFSGRNGMLAQRLADYLQTKDSDWEVIFLGIPAMAYHTHPTLFYLAPQIQGTTVIETWESGVTYVPSRKYLLFVFIPERVNELEAVRASYPGGKQFIEYYESELLYQGYEIVNPEFNRSGGP